MKEWEMQILVDGAKAGREQYLVRPEGAVIPEGLSVTYARAQFWRYRNGNVIHRLILDGATGLPTAFLSYSWPDASVGEPA